MFGNTERSTDSEMDARSGYLACFGFAAAASLARLARLSAASLAAAPRSRSGFGFRITARVPRSPLSCDNYNCGDNDLIDYYDGLENAYARNFEAKSAASAANAPYVEAVGIAGAGEARERAARFRRFANRMRGLGRGNAQRAKRTDRRSQR